MAAYLIDKKIAFVHIPKCGGTSIQHWMKENFSDFVYVEGSNGSTHPTVHEIKKKYKVEKYFAVVRNPWERFISVYATIENNFHHGGEHLKLYSKDGKMPSIKDILEKRNEYWTWGNGFIENFTGATNQVEWLDDSIDFIIKLEGKYSGLDKVQEYLGCYVEPPKLNSSNHKHYRDYYTDETRKIIHNIFEEDIDTFKFSF
jgi:chondroitin 4-sulfotransferase 11